MSASDWVLRKQVKDLYTCGICHEILKEPRFLECHHSFCTACLNSVKCIEGTDMNIVCPTCLLKTELSYDDIRHNLKSDSRAKDVVQMLPATPKTTTTDCSLCASGRGVKVNASVVCVACATGMCSRCASVHKKLSATADHQVFDVRDTPEASIEDSATFDSLDPIQMNNNDLENTHDSIQEDGSTHNARSLETSLEGSINNVDYQKHIDLVSTDVKYRQLSSQTSLGERRPMLHNEKSPRYSCPKLCCIIL